MQKVVQESYTFVNILDNILEQAGAKFIGEMLSTNTTLTKLNIQSKHHGEKKLFC